MFRLRMSLLPIVLLFTTAMSVFAEPRNILVHSFFPKNSPLSGVYKDLIAAKELVRLLSLLKGPGVNVVLAQHPITEVSGN